MLFVLLFNVNYEDTFWPEIHSDRSLNVAACHNKKVA